MTYTETIEEIKKNPRTKSRGMSALLKALKDGFDVDDEPELFDYFRKAYRVGRQRTENYKQKLFQKELAYLKKRLSGLEQ
jgi:hypothetical protein